MHPHVRGRGDLESKGLEPLLLGLVVRGCPRAFPFPVLKRSCGRRWSLQRLSRVVPSDWPFPRSVAFDQACRPSGLPPRCALF